MTFLAGAVAAGPGMNSRLCVQDFPDNLTENSMNSPRLTLLSGLLLGLAACGGCVPPHTSAPTPAPPAVGDTPIPGGPSTGAHTGGTGSPNDKDKKPPAKNKPAAPPANPVPAGDPPPPDAPGPDDAVIDPDLKALCGTWEHTCMGVLDRFTFGKDGRWIEEVDGTPDGGAFTIDATKRPRTLDLVDSSGSTSLYIYEIKGKELTLARDAEDGMKRPRGFSGKDISVTKYKG